MILEIISSQLKFTIKSPTEDVFKEITGLFNIPYDAGLFKSYYRISNIDAAYVPILLLYLEKYNENQRNN